MSSETAQAIMHEGEFYDFEEVDSSLLNTLRSGAVLSMHIGRILINNNCPFINLEERQNPDDYHPIRFVELQPDFSEIVKTPFGTEHKIDIYNREYLGLANSEQKPLLMTMELACPSDRGFKAPIISALSQECKDQQRALLVVSSEGFENSLSPKQLKELNFDIITENVFDSIDALLELPQYRDLEIPKMITTGGSRGGTLSLRLAGRDIANQRFKQGKPEYKIEDVISIAPAGLIALNLIKKLKVMRQFSLYETAHVVRKASTFYDDELLNYKDAGLDTKPPLSALGAIAATGRLFIDDQPLDGIGGLIPIETNISILTMKKDGITTPHRWRQEFANHQNARIESIPGHHLSIDSLRKVFQFTAMHLKEDFDRKNTTELA